jgi:hypothetical protein
MPSRIRSSPGPGPVRNSRSTAHRNDPIARPAQEPTRRSNRVGGPPMASEDFKPTQTGKYRLNEKEPGTLLVREAKGGQRASTPPPEAFTQKTGQRLQADGDTFEVHKAKPGSTTSDCLNTAEEVMHQKQLKPFEDDYSREKVTGKVFGGSPKTNIGLAKQAARKQPGAVDEHAAPGKGEGYAMVRQKQVQEGARHHAEGVWGQDGKDRLTLSVWSDGSPEAELRQHTPTFKKYSTDPKSGDTFHDTWKDAFGKDKVTTTVLEKKD